MSQATVPKFLQTKQALAVKAVIALVLAYVIISRALGSGSYWHYLAGVVCLVLGVKFAARTFKKHGKE